MISHEYQCIFIHIPKCAGTSIEQVLLHHEEYDGRGKQDHRSIRSLQVPTIQKGFKFDRENIIEFVKRKTKFFDKAVNNKNPNPRNEYVLTADQYKKYYKCTIVRNPWSRIFSWYRNVENDNLHRRNSNHSNFSDFLRQNIGIGPLRSQLFWIKDFSGNINFDFIGKFENLIEDTNLLFSKLGLTEISLPHLIDGYERERKGPKQNYKDFYDSELIDIVADYYSDEIKLFGYDFD